MPVTNLTSGCQRGPGPRVVERSRLAAEGGGARETVVPGSRSDDRAQGIQPVADPAGRARGPPVDRPGLRVQRLQGAAGRALRHEAHADRDHLQHRDRDARPVGRDRRHVGRARRPAQGDVLVRLLLVHGLRGRRRRRGRRPALARLPRLRRDRRHRPRHRLHLAGLDADQVVPGPARPRDGPRDHGLRRRRADRLAAVGRAARRLRRLAGRRHRARLPHARRHLPRRDDARRLHRAAARRRLEARGLGAPSEEKRGRSSPGQRDRRERDPDAAVLAPVGRPVLQRDRRHRHPRAGGADDPGPLRHGERGGRRRLRRPAVAVQHEPAGSCGPRRRT